MESKKTKKSTEPKRLTAWNLKKTKKSTESKKLTAWNLKN